MELVQAEGPDALTMRRLASHLGLKPMSLYSHISSREELLDAITLKVLEDVEVPPPEGRPPREVIAEAYTNYYLALRKRPGIAALVVRRPVHGDSSTWLRLIDYRQKVLTDMGLTKEQAVDAGRGLAVFASGALLNEIHAARVDDRTGSALLPTPLFDARKYPHLAEVIDEYIHPDFDRSFRVGLEAMLDGFEALAKKK